MPFWRVRQKVDAAQLCSTLLVQLGSRILVNWLNWPTQLDSTRMLCARKSTPHSKLPCPWSFAARILVNWLNWPTRLDSCVCVCVCDVMRFAVIWCDVMWCDLLWCDVMWCDVSDASDASDVSDVIVSDVSEWCEWCDVSDVMCAYYTEINVDLFPVTIT